MRKLVLILMALGIFMVVSSCSKKEERQKWEYKTIKIWGTNYSEFQSRYFYSETENASVPVPLGDNIDLDSLGMEGWELVTVTPLIETVHPNFGHKEYVTGIQPNTRTAGYTYIFKRPYIDNDKKSSETAEEETDTPADSVVTEVEAK